MASLKIIWTNLHKDNHMHGYGYPYPCMLTVHKNKCSWKVFRVWQMSCVVQIPVTDFSGKFKDNMD